MVIKNWEGELLWLLITQVRLMQSQTIKKMLVWYSLLPLCVRIVVSER